MSSNDLRLIFLQIMATMKMFYKALLTFLNKQLQKYTNLNGKTATYY